jgi:hypothetical protein
MQLNLSEENYNILKEIIKGSIEYLEKQRGVNPQQLKRLRELYLEIQQSKLN